MSLSSPHNESSFIRSFSAAEESLLPAAVYNAVNDPKVKIITGTALAQCRSECLGMNVWHQNARGSVNTWNTGKSGSACEAAVEDQ